MHADGLAAARMRAALVRRVLTAATFAAIYLVLLRVLHVNLIFSRTTASGGDMGSHHYVALFLKNDLLPRGRVTGWAPGWYAGIPMLTFYFPLPYALIAALSPLVGYQVAFKLVTASGLLLLPVTCWGAFRVLRLPEPAPLLAAAGSLVFLFMTRLAGDQQFTIYGGNIASTMAGEFPFALSFALVPLTLAVLYRVVEEGRRYTVATLLVTAIVLSHILTTIVLVLALPILVLRWPPAAAGRAAGRLARVFAVAFCLTAFWAVPFIARERWTAHFRWTQLTDLAVLFAQDIPRPIALLAIVGAGVAVWRGERRVLLYVWPAAVAVCLYIGLGHFAPEAALWNARLLPFLYLCELLLAAYGTAVVVARLSAAVRRGADVPLQLARAGLVAVLVAAPIWGSWRHQSFLPGWTQYNYEGFEAKPGWGEAQALFGTLRSLPPGRIMWEFNRDYERFGTTRTLENIPIYTGHPSMEGLLIESSINAPFHFINQAEVSETSTQAVPGIDYPGFDFPTGLRHLRMFGVRYFVAYTDKAKQAAVAAGLPVRASSGHFTVYDVGDGHLVEVPPNRPTLSSSADWRATALAWYRDPARLDVPLVFAAAGDRAARAAFAAPGSAPQPLAHPGPVAGPDAQTADDVIEFTTDRVGEPHVVKVSWFPNWKAEGAEGPWMLSPGLMVVVPTQAHVRLVYADTPADRAGKALTVLGIVALAVPPVVRRLRRRGTTAG